jgi:hypothetical protein
MRRGWTKHEIRRLRHTRRIGGVTYTIFPQPWTPKNVPSWALWQGDRRIGEFETLTAATEWVDEYIVGAAPE